MIQLSLLQFLAQSHGQSPPPAHCQKWERTDVECSLLLCKTVLGASWLNDTFSFQWGNFLSSSQEAWVLLVSNSISSNPNTIPTLRSVPLAECLLHAFPPAEFLATRLQVNLQVFLPQKCSTFPTPYSAYHPLPKTSIKIPDLQSHEAMYIFVSSLDSMNSGQDLCQIHLCIICFFCDVFIAKKKKKGILQTAE